MACVYTHTAPNGEIFYVGMSKENKVRPYQRSKTTRNAVWYDIFTKLCNAESKNVTVTIIPCDNIGEALQKEWELITELTPAGNITYNEENPTKRCDKKYESLFLDWFNKPIEIEGYHKSGYISLTDIFSLGNKYRVDEGLNIANITHFLKSKSTETFINIICKEQNIKPEDVVIRSGKGKSARIFVNYYLAIYAGKYLSDEFHYRVIDTFIKTRHFIARDEGGDEFIALNMALNLHLPNHKKESNNQGHTELVKLMRSKILGDNASTTDWNNATSEQLLARVDLERLLINYLKMGFVENLEHLKEIITKM